MYVANEMRDESQCSALLIAWRVRRAEHLEIPRDRLDDAVAQFALPLLVVCVGVFREVDEVVRVHVGNLTACLIWPG